MKISKQVLSRLAIALLTLGAAATAQAQDATEEKKFSISGFGTISAVKTNDPTIGFKSYSPMPTGSTDEWAFDNDSNLGVQLAYEFSTTTRAVVQLLSRRNHDNSYDPAIDWAYLAYSPNRSLTLRAGRFVAPAYMASESRAVGFSNVWVRPPLDVYQVASINNVDGIDFRYRAMMAGWTYALQGYAGEYDLQQSGGNHLKFNRMLGINLTAERGSWTLRFGHMDVKQTALTSTDQITPAALSAYTGEPKDANSRPLRPTNATCINSPTLPKIQCSKLFTNFDSVMDDFRRDEKGANITGLGYLFDNGRLLSQGEFAFRKGEGNIADQSSAYVTVGYRFGKFLPHFTVSKSLPRTERTDLVVAPAYQVAMQKDFPQEPYYVLNSNTAQKSFGVGFRYDITSSLALKMQVDQHTPLTTMGRGSSGFGFSRVPGSLPALSLSETSVTVSTVSLDFVF